MTTLDNTRQGIERIFFIISVVLILSITLILLTHFNIFGFLHQPGTATLLYLLLYTLAIVGPMLLAQLLLWIIYGFKGLPFQLTVNSKSIAFLIALLAGLSAASLLLNNLLWLFYSEDSAITFLLVSVSVLVGIVLSIGVYKKVVPVLTLKFSKAH